MPFKETTKTKRYVYNGRILNLRQDDVVLPDGKEAKREIVEHKGGSAILVEKDGKILFVRQFRYAYNKELLEIPAGKLDASEDPKQTAIRELEEECGIVADMEFIREVYPSPGYTEEVIRLYRAVNLREGKMHLDEGEFLTSCWIEIEKVKQMVKTGEIKDAKTLIALMEII